MSEISKDDKMGLMAAIDLIDDKTKCVVVLKMNDQAQVQIHMSGALIDLTYAGTFMMGYITDLVTGRIQR